MQTAFYLIDFYYSLFLKLLIVPIKLISVDDNT